ncbi:DUF1043 family protein [Paraneptunicella aestuarii]|uniref:ZapG family protein n=1 Tax=Paraneptunicella aestuarii TaxID=2831148 RepID=UPI001E61D8C5|nr:DUF1043 family protein [Paraneptunicella aestuarii]UAA38436.1 DUF1043 family protein [Paraneptunicella aestuarii]
MDWLVGILLVVVGAIVGFFVAKYFLTQSGKAKTKSHTEQSERELLTEQALIHVSHSRKMLEEIQRQSNALQAQMDAYEDIIIQTKGMKDGDSLPFFSDQATTFLRSKQKEVKTTSQDIGFQPPDYSQGNSGLFGSSKTESERKKTGS